MKKAPTEARAQLALINAYVSEASNVPGTLGEADALWCGDTHSPEADTLKRLARPTFGDGFQLEAATVRFAPRLDFGIPDLRGSNPSEADESRRWGRGSAEDGVRLWRAVAEGSGREEASAQQFKTWLNQAKRIHGDTPSIFVRPPTTGSANPREVGCVLVVFPTQGVGYEFSGFKTGE